MKKLFFIVFTLSIIFILASCNREFNWVRIEGKSSEEYINITPKDDTVYIAYKPICIGSLELSFEDVEKENNGLTIDDYDVYNYDVQDMEYYSEKDLFVHENVNYDIIKSTNINPNQYYYFEIKLNKKIDDCKIKINVGHMTSTFLQYKVFEHVPLRISLCNYCHEFIDQELREYTAINYNEKKTIAPKNVFVYELHSNSPYLNVRCNDDNAYIMVFDYNGNSIKSLNSTYSYKIEVDGIYYIFVDSYECSNTYEFELLNYIQD